MPRASQSLFPDTSWGLVLAARDRSGADACSSLPAQHVAISLPKSALQRLVGNYAHDEMAMAVTLQDDTLTAQLAGQPAFEIFAESPTRRRRDPGFCAKRSIARIDDPASGR